MRPVALEASGWMGEHPSGVAQYGFGLLGGLRETGSIPLELVYPAGRWSRRSRLTELGVPARPYWSGRRLGSRYGLVHLLDTRMPVGYRGPLVATLFDLIAVNEVSDREELAPARFRVRKAEAYDSLTRRADVIVTLAATIASEIRERYPRARRIEVVPPGVEAPSAGELDAAATRLAEFGIRPPYVIAVGALCARKNLGAVIEAYRRVRDGEPELRLVLAGAPNYGWAGSAAERAAKELGEDVVRTGYLPRPTLWAAIDRAECLMQLSHYEGYGLAVLEALALGTPVVASRRGGLVDAVGSHGFLVEPDDPEAAADGLREALRGGPSIEAKRRAGVTSARERTWSRAAERIAAIYSSLSRS